MAYAAAGPRPRIERLERETIDAAMARVATVARVMDALFVIPGTRIRLGFDAILGLVPVFGDLLAQAISTYIIWEAHQLGVGKLTLMRMLGNTLVDTVIGSIPIAGDAFDVAFRANMKTCGFCSATWRSRAISPPPAAAPLAAPSSTPTTAASRKQLFSKFANALTQCVREKAS